MLAGLDSATPPSSAALAAAKAAGINLWAGYFKFTSTDHVLRGWSDTDFKRVLDAGMATLAFCSGQDDPVLCKNRGISLSIPIALDDEGGMRADGPWVGPWLAASGAGLYGNGSFHYAGRTLRTAAFHIFAGYYGYDPRITWPGWLPKDGFTGAFGWQWQGSHGAYGMTVDSAWYDSAITSKFGPSQGQGGLDLATADEIYTELRGDGAHSKLDIILAELRGQGPYSKLDELLGLNGISTAANPGALAQAEADLRAAIAAIPTSPTAQPADLTPVLTALAAMQAELDEVHARVSKDLA